MGLPTDAKSISGVLIGAFLTFFAYLGFEDMVNVAEEAKIQPLTYPELSLFP